MDRILTAIRRDLAYNENGVCIISGEDETAVNVDGIEVARINWSKGKVIRGHLATDKAREVFDAVANHFKFEQPPYIPCPDCGGKGTLCETCNQTGSIEGDPGIRKVVNLVTNYMSALCETGRVPGRVDRNIEAGTAVYFPGGGAAEFIGSPEDCARVLNEYFL